MNSVGDAFSGLFEVPPFDVIIGLLGILIFGLMLGALIYLPVAEKNSTLSLERLSGEIIWRYKPDWIIFVLGCLVFLAVSFLMVSGLLREL
ncbi:MAG: hypothetical protein IJG33_15065 [Selenomonadaceae bacterium]|nr:hypothetical protein [Selenomonadaceae bacterium]MBQ3444552.1 hypothetical protein [Selenomonadaceae bacterium]MBQ6759606.1 hypothetical protein [Selenomonadaceae bacterium]MBR0102886.1 hypothetical protein [Selenomonadaceae bacterium]MBR6712605.1 hypothetical protein [Selenomonadaceae bacterium]